MPGLIVSGFLLAMLLLVHLSLRQQPMPRAKPLNVDTGLPLPEVGQASTIFSLTALFGAYLGVHLLLGLPALLGLATGTVGALLLIRRWIDSGNPTSFEDHLASVLGGSHSNLMAFSLGVAGIQCAFATSELIILRHIAATSLGMHADHATLMVIALGLIAYFYVLFGGYMAVFRTDVLQFVFTAVMGVLALAELIPQSFSIRWQIHISPRPGYWTLPSLDSIPVLYCYHFIIGAVMGFGFLVASPDAWKRVFLVSTAGKRSQMRFFAFVAIGAAPFLVLVPMGVTAGNIPDGPIDARTMWAEVISNNTLYLATALGLTGSFLSAFNGALLSSVHMGLMARRRMRRPRTELPRFHWLMVSALLTIFLLFAGLRNFPNPYILGNLLLGPYAIIAGVLVGSRGSIARLRDGTLIWIMVLGFLGWFLYLVSRGLSTVPTTYQINTVPVGVAAFVLTATVCWVSSIGRTRFGQPQGRL